MRDERFFARVLADADLGFGESYMDGDWDCDRLDELAARLFAAELDRIAPRPIDLVNALIARIITRQTRRRVRRDVAPHYNLGNDLFEAMLDTRYMAYTCAYWREGARTLEEAQEAKLDLVCRKLTLEPGMRVLDIGCGWGGFARFAAERYGVSVTGVTLSREQAALGTARTAGLPVDLRVEDYREVSGTFDRVVSIGCLEHIGHRNHRRFFEVVRARLADGGYALVHSIGVCRTDKPRRPLPRQVHLPPGQPSVHRANRPWHRRIVRPRRRPQYRDRLRPHADRVAHAFRAGVAHSAGTLRPPARRALQADVRVLFAHVGRVRPLAARAGLADGPDSAWRPAAGVPPAIVPRPVVASDVSTSPWRLLRSPAVIDYARK